MGNFIEVTESRYGKKMLLNLDNVVAVPISGNPTIYTNAVHGEGNGNFQFSEKEMRKIVRAINNLKPKQEGE